ncbi:MAG: winged helix-turn-helix transcriptional regulator [Betaproteobacteria bacterium]|nr:winged helix-turn-helix transcriptional regulator [Betaproteobacteria bacterium]
MGKSLESSKGSAWALFLTAHAVLVEKIEQQFSAAGMPPFGWYDVLWGLERAAGHRLRMHELAEMTVISRSNLTRLVDRLEAVGLVARERAEEDRRGAFAVLTAEGKAMRKKMWPVYSAAIKKYFEDHISEQDAEQMGKAMRRILSAARDEKSRV